MSNLMGRNEYARHRNCSPSAVTKAMKSGRIEAAVQRDAAGNFVGINAALADQLWTSNTDPELALRTTPSAAPEIIPPPATPRGNEGDEFLVARARRENYAANTAELDYLEKIGRLTNVEDVRDENFMLWRELRDKLLNIPDRISTILASEREPVRCHDLLTREIKRVLNERADAAAAAATEGTAEREAA
ncbi:MAG TPA: hypothetical protein VMT94_01405 [Burkholderiales bacterium]|nr:hypothetical protein [Burkholderiales bacterium]